MMEVLESAIRKYGKPEIFTLDQGTQFTSLKFVSLLKTHKIKQSRDGKGRALDNVFIERYWRSYKYEYLFLNPPKDAWELFSETEKYVKFYNKEGMRLLNALLLPMKYILTIENYQMFLNFE